MSNREKKYLNQTISGNIGHSNPAMDIENEDNNIKAPKSLIDTKNLEIYDLK